MLDNSRFYMPWWLQSGNGEWTHAHMHVTLCVHVHVHVHMLIPNPRSGTPRTEAAIWDVAVGAWGVDKTWLAHCSHGCTNQDQGPIQLLSSVHSAPFAWSGLIFLPMIMLLSPLLLGPPPGFGPGTWAAVPR